MLNRAEILFRFLISLVALILFNWSLNKKAFVGFFLKIKLMEISSGLIIAGIIGLIAGIVIISLINKNKSLTYCSENKHSGLFSYFSYECFQYFAKHSLCSDSGSESATIPAPA